MSMQFPPPPIKDGPSIHDQMAYGIVIVFMAFITAPLGMKVKAAIETKEVPNALTQLRLLLVIPLLASLLLGLFIHAFLWVALFIWILGCLSDFYDGRWSRKWKHISNFGKYWDPVADKSFTIPALFAFVVLMMMPFALIIGVLAYCLLYGAWWPVYTFREWRVTSLRNKFKVVYPKKNIQADNTGKYKTACVMFGGAGVILEAALGLSGSGRLIADIVNALLLGAATAFSIYSWLFIYEGAYKIEPEDKV